MDVSATRTPIIMPFLHVGQVGHNNASLGTEFSHTTATPTNSRLIRSLSPPLGGKLLWHVSKPYWMVEVRHISKSVFLSFCPILVYTYVIKLTYFIIQREDDSIFTEGQIKLPVKISYNAFFKSQNPYYEFYLMLLEIVAFINQYCSVFHLIYLNKLFWVLNRKFVCQTCESLFFCNAISVWNFHIFLSFYLLSLVYFLFDWNIFTDILEKLLFCLRTHFHCTVVLLIFFS